MRMEAEGYGANIAFDGTTILVTGKGLGKSALGASSREIAVSELTSVDFKDANMLVNGHIELVTANGKTQVHFRRKQSEAMRAAYKAILGAVPSVSEGKAKAPMASSLRDRQLEREAEAATRAVESNRDELEAALALVNDFQPIDAAQATGMDVMLAQGETLYLKLEGAACVEVRAAAGQFRGRSQSMSFRVARGVSYRVGGARGQYVPGPQSPAVLDTGTALITSKRVVFRGDKESREWKFDKLTGIEDAEESWTALPVTNRQKTSGIGYPHDIADDVRLRLRLALADYHGSRDHLRSEIESQLAQLPEAPGQSSTT